MKIFELEKYKDNIAFIDECGRKVYYGEVIKFVKRIISININRNIFVKK
ncbi:MAG: hypothetical protein NC489_39040 [Ruminococcus flavefaciens]|nr:hypothetical protein [Ruminococcus flavefaciens]